MRYTVLVLTMAGCNFGSKSLTTDGPSDARESHDAIVIPNALRMPNGMLALDASSPPPNDASVADVDIPPGDGFAFPDASLELDTRLSYTWDDRQVLCSKPLDDLDKPIDWGRVEQQFFQAEQHQWVALVHGHKPNITISVDAINRVLDLADEHHLAYLTFDQLSAGPPRAGVALSIDDDDVDGWLNILQPLLAAHHAKVTFFVTRWPQLNQARLGELATLVADGNTLEAHSIDHVDAVEYVTANGLDAYLNNEVVPSIQIMVAAGYHPTSFAFPFGSTTPEISAAILQHVARVRTTPGPCPIKS
ncbi:MAG TPA: polysaccharide deacetylase family protein [Kofleriaceae bacterium]|jgi:hypothetical protein|nr:polysaccharide deacetylase family protein [Kofleriaceae bacterium]